MPFQLTPRKPGKPELGDGRHVLRLRRPLVVGQRQHAHRAGRGMRQRFRQRNEHRRHVAADDVGERRRGAAIAHRVHFQSRALEEQRHQQIADAARPAAAGISELLRTRLHIGDELLQRLDRQLAVDDQHLRAGADQADRREVLHRVVGRLAERRERSKPCRCRPRRSVCPSARRAHDIRRRERAHGADAVLDHELLAEHLGEPRAGDAREIVDIAAGGEADQHAHRLLRPVLRKGGRRGERRREGGAGRQQRTARDDRCGHDTHYTTPPNSAVIRTGQHYLSHNMGGGVARGRGIKRSQRRRFMRPLSGATVAAHVPRQRECGQPKTQSASRANDTRSDDDLNRRDRRARGARGAPAPRSTAWRSDGLRGGCSEIGSPVSSQ